VEPLLALGREAPEEEEVAPVPDDAVGDDLLEPRVLLRLAPLEEEAALADALEKPVAGPAVRLLSGDEAVKWRAKRS